MCCNHQGELTRNFLLQNRVYFVPEVDHIGARKALIRVGLHEAKLGKYLFFFDGTLLYNITRLPQVSLSFGVILKLLNSFLFYV
jgi:hypothetical protein